MVHDFTGLLHLVAAFGAMAIGGIIFLRPKGGKAHQRFGYVYVVLMSVLLVTALLIYRLTGQANIFHGLALVSAVSVALGLFHAMSKRPRGTWHEWHYQWMSWSYVGLLAAFIAETVTRVALPTVTRIWGDAFMAMFWSIVALASVIVLGTGAYLIQRNAPKLKSNE